LGHLRPFKIAAISWNGQSSFQVYIMPGTSSTTKSGADGKIVLLFRDLGSSWPYCSATYWFFNLALYLKQMLNLIPIIPWTTDTASGGLKKY
jgi:hypothetical protein